MTTKALTGYQLAAHLATSARAMNVDTRMIYYAPTPFGLAYGPGTVNRRRIHRYLRLIQTARLDRFTK